MNAEAPPQRYPDGAIPECAASQGAAPDRSALVISVGIEVAPALLSGLQEQDVRMTLLADAASVAGVADGAQAGDAQVTAPPSGGIHRLPLKAGSRAAVQSAVDAAVAAAGAPDLVVLSVMPAISQQLTELADLPEAAWHESVREALRTTLHILQAIGPAMADRGGTVVFLAPSLSLVGCRGLVPLTTALEGQRGLMKSVARQWGHRGITLNWIAVTPGTLSPALAAAPLAIKADAVPVALGRGLELGSEVAPVIVFLASAAGRKITGATLCLDGGEWMLP